MSNLPHPSLFLVAPYDLILPITSVSRLQFHSNTGKSLTLTWDQSIFSYELTFDFSVSLVSQSAPHEMTITATFSPGNHGFALEEMGSGVLELEVLADIRTNRSNGPRHCKVAKAFREAGLNGSVLVMVDAEISKKIGEDYQLAKALVEAQENVDKTSVLTSAAAAATAANSVCHANAEYLLEAWDKELWKTGTCKHLDWFVACNILSRNMENRYRAVWGLMSLNEGRRRWPFVADVWMAGWEASRDIRKKLRLGEYEMLI